MENQEKSRINKLFVSYEIAKQLKDKGFDEPCFGYYLQGIFHTENGIDFNFRTNSYLKLSPMKDLCSAPMFHQVVDFFREKHDIHIVPVPVLTRKYYFVVDRAFKPKIETEELDYYEAFSSAIEQALKLI